MARKPMITRTMKTTEAEILCMDLESTTPVYRTVVLPRTYKDERAVLKKAKEVLETETLKCVHCEEYETKETLYGMDEQTFIDNAEILPSRK